MEHTRQMFRYDVFLSFRGMDTRNNFTSHLYEALKRHNFQVFHDTSLPIGQRIPTQLSEAIKESQICIVVFSTRYANSKWCLEELSHMMHCMDKHKNDQRIILPVYLDVKQSDAHTLFEELITNHETEFDHVTVEKWREALQKAGELAGLHLQDDANGDEYELLDQVVEKIRKMLRGQLDINVGDPHLVGIESRVHEVISLLNMGSDEVRVVVIRGPAGIGKTTIAKATYERLDIHFKAQNSCFIPDVKAIFGETNGKLTLQKRLMSNLVRSDERCIRVDNYHQGIGKIEKMVKNQKLLLVLDDVDNDEQLKILGMNREKILGRGSRIIVTTREDLSNVVGWIKPDDAVYEPQLLDENESFEVFCLNAFRQAHSKEGYEDVSREAACWGAGCPGVLKALAVYMKDYQSVQQWGSALRYAIQNPSYLTDGSL